MARIRTIKPGFFRHEELFETERETGFPMRVAFAGLWTACDREGRFAWKPRELKLDCLPHDDVDFSRVLDALWTRGFIEKYVVNGKEFGFIKSWHVHQIINNREQGSALPEPNETNILTRGSRVPDACLSPLVQVQGEGKGREEEGKGREEEGKGTDISAVAIAPAAVPELDLSSGKSPSMAKALLAAAIAPKLFDDFWEAYPRRDGANPKEPARKRFLAALKSGEDADAIIAAAKAYRDELRRTGTAGTQYVARAVTWLNERRWADYAAVVANAQAPPGHKAAPGSAEFVAWRTHWRDTGNRVMVQLLDQRELEGRSFEFLAQWPPGIEMADRRDVA